jgi:hypothetical protein
MGFFKLNTQESKIGLSSCFNMASLVAVWIFLMAMHVTLNYKWVLRVACELRLNTKSAFLSVIKGISSRPPKTRLCSAPVPPSHMSRQIVARLGQP